MTYIDSAILDLTEWFCHRFQMLTGRTNVWLALQLTNLSIIVYFIWAGVYFWSSDAVVRLPDQAPLAHALARLLAAAPDDRVRDGRRAMEIVQRLLKEDKTTDLGETMAMAFAELGDYDRAAGVQRGVMAAARDAGLQQSIQRMEENLRLYENHRPCRTLWFDVQ